MSARAPRWAGAVGGRRANRVGDPGAPPAHALSAGEAAWLAAIPCSLLLLAIVLALGPAVGRALLPTSTDSTFWPQYLTADTVRPEPVEQARYLLALLGPVLLAGSALALRRRRVRSDAVRAAALLGPVALAVLFAICFAYQRGHVYEYELNLFGARSTAYFTLPTLAAAAAIALLAAAALHHPPTAARLAAVGRETPVRRVGAAAVAALFVLAWLLTSFNTDATINLAHDAVWTHVGFYSDEAFSILGGHAPLVDFHAQYGHLWAYAAAGGMTLLGTSLGAYSAIMLAGTAGTMAAVYGTLRRVAASSTVALALFLPLLATSFFLKIGPLENRFTSATLFSVFPIRYFGPYILLWLVVRRIDRRPQRPPIGLFAVAGLATINNPEFGAPALGAALVALGATSPDRSLAALGRLVASALAGLAVAAALVCGLTLAVAGSLPHFELLLTFPRIFGAAGFGMLPLPPLGLHLVLYVTFAAAVVVAAVRAVAGDAAPALTGALAWAGTFGLGASAYFAGRSHPHNLTDLFSVWALALVLLTIVVAQAIAQRPSRRPTVAELLVLAGFGVLVCSLPQTPTPWSQIERLGRTQPAEVRVTTALVGVVRALTRRDEPVALLMKLGQRFAYEAGIDDVTPYANIESMVTVEQWEETIAALRRAHGTRIVTTQPSEPQAQWLVEHGYEPERGAAELGIVEYVARRDGS